MVLVRNLYAPTATATPTPPPDTHTKQCTDSLGSFYVRLASALLVMEGILFRAFNVQINSLSIVHAATFQWILQQLRRKTALECISSNRQNGPYNILFHKQLARVGTSKHTPGANVCVSSEVNCVELCSSGCRPASVGQL